MANLLAKTIMNNISKKSLGKDIKQGYCKKSEEKEVCNINKKEEEILKNILNKNKTKMNLNSLKSKNEDNPKIKPQSLKSLSNKSESNISKQIPREDKKKKITSLRDLAK